MRAWLPTVADVLLVLGMASVAAGAALVYVPAGLIVGGLALLALGLLKSLSHGGR